MTDEQLQFVLGRLWLAALAAASGFERRSREAVESAAVHLATMHGGRLLDWYPPWPPATDVVARGDAKR